ncbi:MAG: FAD-binding protein [Rhodospirillaceae bacterium]|nr:FAD-binding protein [Rhodospirillaceae bacterium]
MAILLIAEHDNKILKPATLNAATAASELGACGMGDVCVLVAGHDCASVADEATKINGITKILLADSAQYQNALAENMAPLIVELAKDYDAIIAPATTSGKNILPRVAALLDVQQISEITKIISNDTFQRPIFAGNAIATVKSLDGKKIITVRTTAFAAAGSDGNGIVEEISTGDDFGLSSFVRDELTKSDRPELTSAKIIISGGRGMGSAENFKLLDAVADKLNAAIGASRAAVDSGFAPNDYQVGQTGKVVAPELYIAVGISGAIQHMAGMKDSKVIVAINKDSDAPIFQVADYGMVADLFDVLPELAKALE